jgi:glycosyltransferase involved in cell wall biosynthesis
MKISIGTKIKEGPWGGGNLFAINLKDFLIKNGHKVVHTLVDQDIDIVLITEPRKSSESSAFTHAEVKKYSNFVNKDTLIVHRVNECDERKNTNYVNKYLMKVNEVADHTIFVSNWLKELYELQGINTLNNNVIMAGANSEIFNSDNFKPWNNSGKIKLVTHHWGANWNKGFDSYKLIDDLMQRERWKNRIEFTYIGNIPAKFSFNNVEVVQPLSGIELANQIKKNHVYITGSLNEPSGNHHIEAAQCGLPLLYIDSGGIPEYCENFGVKYSLNNLEEKLEEVIEDYQKYVYKIESYPYSADKMANEYLELFKKMLSEKENLISSRLLKSNNKLLPKKIFQIKRGIGNFFKN